MHKCVHTKKAHYICTWSLRHVIKFMIMGPMTVCDRKSGELLPNSAVFLSFTELYSLFYLIVLVLQIILLFVSMPSVEYIQKVETKTNLQD